MSTTAEKQSQKTGRGGRRPGAGRPKGSKSKKTLELEAAAKEYAGDALRALVHVATKGRSESARIAAAVALLDRGFGRPRQAVEVTGKEGGPVAISVTRRVVKVDGGS